MEAESQAAEQIVRIALAGSETAVRLTGAGAKNLAALLVAASSSHEKTKGKARLAAMLRGGRELSVFTLPRERLGDFAREAKRYGVLYAVVRERGTPTSTDLIVRAEDASKVNRIVERLALGTVARAMPEPERPGGDLRPPERGAEGARSHEEARALIAGIVEEPDRREEAHAGPAPLAAGPTAAPRSGNTSGPARSSERDGCDGAPGRRSVRRRVRAMERERRNAAPGARGAADAREKGKAR